MPDELWTEVHDIVQETGMKTIPKKKKCKKAKWLSEEALQMAVKKEAKSKGEKERDTHLNTEFQRIALLCQRLRSVLFVLEVFHVSKIILCELHRTIRVPHYFASKGPPSQGYSFSSSHVWM